MASFIFHFRSTRLDCKLRIDAVNEPGAREKALAVLPPLAGAPEDAWEEVGFRLEIPRRVDRLLDVRPTASVLRESVPSRIRALRAEMGFTRTELARAAGVSPTQVTQWEEAKRRPNLASAYRLAVAFRVPMHELLGLVDPADGPPSGVQFLS